MNAETRRAALRATHAVALGTLAACTAATTTTTPAPKGEPTPAVTASTDCQERVDEAFPDGDPYPFPSEKVSHDPVVRECCANTLAGVYIRRTPDPIMMSHRWACCASVDVAKVPNIGPACTPWGPPVPPKMTRAKDRAAGAEAETLAARRRRRAAGG